MILQVIENEIAKLGYIIRFRDLLNGDNLAFADVKIDNEAALLDLILAPQEHNKTESRDLADKTRVLPFSSWPFISFFVV